MREIWVGNLPDNISENTLYKAFFIYGEISNIEIHREKCFAFIRYRLCASASRAYEKAKNMNIGNNIIRVSFSDSGKRREIKGDEPGYELTEKKCKLLHVSLNKNSLLPTEQVIRDVFSKFGNVKYVLTKSCAGYRSSIYVEYAKYEEAEKAVNQMNTDEELESRTKLGDSQCEVNYYFKKKKYPNENLPIPPMNPGPGGSFNPMMEMGPGGMYMNMQNQPKMPGMGPMMPGMYPPIGMMNPMCK